MHWSSLVRFLAYGGLGWCLEILFTGLVALLARRDRAATGTTYLWMFPIYGAGGLLLELAAAKLGACAWPLRLICYLTLIYALEYTSGGLLRRLLGRCPWDYSGRGLNVHGLVRLDYAPGWLVICVLFEPAHRVLLGLASHGVS